MEERKIKFVSAKEKREARRKRRQEMNHAQSFDAVEEQASTQATPEPAEEKPPFFKKYRIVILGLGSLIFLTILVLAFLFPPKSDPPKVEKEPTSQPKIEPKRLESLKDLDPQIYSMSEEKVFPGNMTISGMLMDLKIPANTRRNLVKEAQKGFDFSNLTQHTYLLIKNKQNKNRVSHIVFLPNSYQQVIFSAEDDAGVYLLEKPYVKELVKIKGIIKDRLYSSLLAAGANIQIMPQLNQAYDWTLNFRNLKQNDPFKLIYEEIVDADNKRSIGQLLCAQIERGDKKFYAFYFPDPEFRGYYDAKGNRLMGKTYLLSPVAHGEVTSAFGKRFHPIDKIEKMHWGTDYAASEGTPIRAVGSGTILEAGERSPGHANGIFVKIKHDEIYKSQYLHMSRLAAGIHPNAQVVQGQTIGYVGSTGKSTGPHVCFRFWKGNSQVNHLTEDLPQKTEQLPKQLMKQFTTHRDSLIQQLDAIVNVF